MQRPIKQKYYVLILIFMTAYPFLVLPFWNIYYVTLIKLVYLSLFVIIMWYFFIYQCFREKRLLGVLQTKGEKLAVLFFLLICISTLFSQDPMVSFLGGLHKVQGLIAWFSYISLFLFTYILIPINKQVNIIRLVVFASFFVGVYGIVQHFHLDSLTGKPVDRSFVKSWAVFDNANYFGTYLVIVIILAMTLYLSVESRRGYFIYWIIVSTLFISLLYTTTRGAWIGAFSGVFILTVLLVWKRRDIWKRWAILLFSLLFLLVIVNVSEDNYIFNRIFSIGEDANALVSEDDGDAGAGRWTLWKTSFPLIKDYYLIGSGPSTFSIVYPTVAGENKLHDNSHNEYLETAITLGVPALLVYLALMFIILKSSLSTAKRLNGNEAIFAYGLIAAIIGYLVQTFFNVSVVTVAPFFWMVLGMSYAFSMSKRDT
ncbi:O-antigen ligase family protein [Virgibacillus byunsanensis]|uniref:O-antigen ligase family protein n=1 Tax=Virgibacillus byunsanensis TaxID=570945 RepID=A0ABW3LJ70_9BACI